MADDLTAALRAYQQAVEFMGEAQRQTAEARERMFQFQTTQDAAGSALYAAQDRLLEAARDVHLPPPHDGRLVSDNPQA